MDVCLHKLLFTENLTLKMSLLMIQICIKLYKFAAFLSVFSSIVVAEPLKVAVIGCGPGGMFFLHALAHRRRRFEEEGDTEGLARLPIVTVFEKNAEPGGVWRSADEEGSTNMYDGLWINGPKEAMEFFDYTFDAHFGSPKPVYLPRRQILDYMIQRVTSIDESIFRQVRFSTAVTSVAYNTQNEQFEIISEMKGSLAEAYDTFDRCIWAGGMYSELKIPKGIQDMLVRENFTGTVLHSTQVTNFDSTVNGKRVLFIGDSLSAEDLALQALKLGAEKIYMSSRSGEGQSTDMGGWPGNKVQILKKSLPYHVNEDGSGLYFHQVEWDDDMGEYKRKEGSEITEIRNISAVVFCTGYDTNLDYLAPDLKPAFLDSNQEEVKLSVPEGWISKPNSLSDDVGSVTPSQELDSSEYFMGGLYDNLLISNPKMMFIIASNFYILEADVAAWVALAYISGHIEIPSKIEMERRNLNEHLSYMNFPYLRNNMDPNYGRALLQLPNDHWYNDHSSPNYERYYKEVIRFGVEDIVKNMVESGYPGYLGTSKELSERVEDLVHLDWESVRSRLQLNTNGTDSAWRTFRDCDPSPYRSLYTGTRPVPLNGRWMDLDDDGNLPGSTNSPLNCTLLDSYCMG